MSASWVYFSYLGCMACALAYQLVSIAAYRALKTEGLADVLFLKVNKWVTPQLRSLYWLPWRRLPDGIGDTSVKVQRLFRAAQLTVLLTAISILWFMGQMLALLYSAR